MRLHMALATVLTAALAAAPAPGQTPDGDASVVLRGRVIDATNGIPLPGARVSWDDTRRVAVTDTAGRFELADVRGRGFLRVDHYGYGETSWVMMIGDSDMDLGDLRVRPDPLLVEGVTVVAERIATIEQRLRNRRNAVPVAVRMFGQDRLVTTAARDMVDFLRLEGGLHPASCGRWTMGSMCVFRRGRVVEPRVFIDEAPAIGGMDQLASYRPYELHLVEVFSSGLEIRAYTRHFMERMVRRPRTLIPIIW